MQRPYHGSSDRTKPAHRKPASPVPIFPTGGPQLGIVDSKKASRLSDRRPVRVYVGRFRGTHPGKPSPPQPGCITADGLVRNGYFLLYREVSGQEWLHIEPTSQVQSLEELVERLRQDKQFTELYGGSISTSAVTVMLGNADQLFYQSFAKAFGANHNNGVIRAQFQLAKMPDGSTINDTVESYGLESSLY